MLDTCCFFFAVLQLYIQFFMFVADQQSCPLTFTPVCLECKQAVSMADCRERGTRKACNMAQVKMQLSTLVQAIRVQYDSNLRDNWRDTRTKFNYLFFWSDQKVYIFVKLSLIYFIRQSRFFKVKLSNIKPSFSATRMQTITSRDRYVGRSCKHYNNTRIRTILPTCFSSVWQDKSCDMFYYPRYE